jgi:hypothetical protein
LFVLGEGNPKKIWITLELVGEKLLIWARSGEKNQHFGTKLSDVELRKTLVSKAQACGGQCHYLPYDH